MERQVFEQWLDWAHSVSASDAGFPDFDAILEDGEAVMAELFRTLGAQGLPPGAVIEIEFGVRRREAVFA